MTLCFPSSKAASQSSANQQIPMIRILICQPKVVMQPGMIRLKIMPPTPEPAMTAPKMPDACAPK